MCNAFTCPCPRYLHLAQYSCYIVTRPTCSIIGKHSWLQCVSLLLWFNRDTPLMDSEWFHSHDIGYCPKDFIRQQIRDVLLPHPKVAGRWNNISKGWRTNIYSTIYSNLPFCCFSIHFDTTLVDASCFRLHTLIAHALRRAHMARDTTCLLWR